MLTLSIELVMMCCACNAPMALNAWVSELRCDRCERSVALDEDAWKQLLADQVARATDIPERVEVESTIELAQGVVRRLVRREPPRCRGCRAPIDMSAVLTALGELGDATHGHSSCAACGLEATLRRPSVAIPALAGLFDEEAEAIDPSTAHSASPKAAATAIACPNCGGALSLDGTTRLITCGYCSSPVQLADEVWARIHPIRPVRAFQLVVTPLAADARQDAKFTYDEVQRAVTDAAGNVYALGSVKAARGEKADYFRMAEQDTPFRRVVWSWDPELRLRWLQHCNVDDACMVLLPGDTDLLVWSSDDGESRVLRTADGKPSKREMPVPLEDAIGLLADPDGTFIRTTSTKAERFTPEGDALPLFDVKTGFFHGLVTEDHVTGLGPLGGAFLITSGGDLFVIDSMPPDDTLRLQRFVRNGDSNYFETDDRVSIFPPRLTFRAVSDTVFILHDPDCRTLFRMELTTPKNLGRSSRVTSADTFTVLPDGSLLVFRGQGAMLRFGSDERFRKLWENDENARAERLSAAANMDTEGDP